MGLLCGVTEFMSFYITVTDTQCESKRSTGRFSLALLSFSKWTLTLQDKNKSESFIETSTSKTKLKLWDFYKFYKSFCYDFILIIIHIKQEIRFVLYIFLLFVCLNQTELHSWLFLSSRLNLTSLVEVLLTSLCSNKSQLNDTLLLFVCLSLQQTKTGLALLFDEHTSNAYDVCLKLTKELLIIQKQDVVCVSGGETHLNVSTEDFLHNTHEHHTCAHHTTPHHDIWHLCHASQSSASSAASASAGFYKWHLWAIFRLLILWHNESQ